MEEAGNKNKGSNRLFILFVLIVLATGAVLAYAGRPHDAAKTDNTTTKTADSDKQKTKASLACKQAPADKVGKLLGSEVKRIGGNYEDRKEPEFLSVCSYVTDKKPARTATIVINGNKDKKTAEDSIKQTGKREGAKAISKLGDQAYFIKPARQLIVRTGDRIATITISEPRDHSKIEPEQATIKIAELILKNQ